MAALIFFLFCSPSFATELTIDRIFSSPELDGTTPQKLKFSPNGKRLSFLQGKTDNYEVLDLYEYDLTTGKPKLLVDSNSLKFGEMSEAEKSRRERMRVSKSGIVDYEWSHDATQILFPANGELYLYAKAQPLRKVSDFNDALDPKFSPKDNYVSFVHAANLYIKDLAKNKMFAVTKDGKGTITNATAEFIAQEEMDRFTGYWWSEDEKYLAFTRYDESQVLLLDRYEIDAGGVTVKKQRYPQAGTNNVKIQLGVISLTDVKAGKAKPIWIPLATTPDIYLARVDWTQDGKLSFQVQSRDQKKLELFLYDPATKKRSLVLTETDPHWVNLTDNYKWLKKSQNFIWSNERTGFSHLSLIDRNGKVVRPITSGDWVVDSLKGVDPDEKWVYFLASKKTVLEKHLYRSSLLKTGEPELLTDGDTWNEVVLSKDANVFVRTFSTPTTPTQTELRKSDGKLISALSKNSLDEKHPLFPYQKEFSPVEFSNFKGPSGDTIEYSIVKPLKFKASKKYPLIVIGYGGPHAQMVTHGWGSKWTLWRQVLAKKGFVVATFDNRGSARRGKKFESSLDRGMATAEVEDQVAGVKHLIAKGFIDKDKVGFFGWSYGGYMSLMLAMKAPDVFRANVAVAPVTDFSLYDTHYEERYMGKPEENKEAYKRANVLEFTPALKARLMVIHGMADDNVLFINSTMLFKKLQSDGKLYESVTYPGARHGIYGKQNQKHVFTTTTDFFERYLLGAGSKR